MRINWLCGISSRALYILLCKETRPQVIGLIQVALTIWFLKMRHEGVIFQDHLLCLRPPSPQWRTAREAERRKWPLRGLEGLSPSHGCRQRGAADWGETHRQPMEWGNGKPLKQWLLGNKSSFDKRPDDWTLAAHQIWVGSSDQKASQEAEAVLWKQSAHCVPGMWPYASRWGESSEDKDIIGHNFCPPPLGTLHVVVRNL